MYHFVLPLYMYMEFIYHNSLYLHIHKEILHIYAWKYLCNTVCKMYKCTYLFSQKEFQLQILTEFKLLEISISAV